MKQRCAQHRSPQGSLAAQQRHRHHEDAESDSRESHLQGLDEAHHVAEDGADDAEEKCRDAPRHYLVALGVNAHGLGLVLVVANSVDGEPEAGRVKPLQKNEGRDGGGETHVVEEQGTGIRIAGVHRHGDAAAAAQVVPAGDQLRYPQGEPQGADGEVGSAKSEHGHAQHKRA